MTIDMEYAMILTKFEVMFIWGPISPLIIPLTLFSVYVNYSVYHHRIMKNGWAIEPFDESVVFPVWVLWIGIGASQVIVCLILFVCVGLEVGAALASALFLVDVCCWYVLRRKGNANENMEQMSDPRKPNRRNLGHDLHQL